MTFIWFIFASLTVTGAVLYNVSVKAAGAHINAFIFTVALTAVALVAHLCCLLFYKFYLHEEVSMQADQKGLWLAVAAGIGVVLIDLGFFFAVKTGGLASSNLFWFVGSLTLTTVAGYFLFHEPFNTTKFIGIVFGVISAVLITKP